MTENWSGKLHNASKKGKPGLKMTKKVNKSKRMTKIIFSSFIFIIVAKLREKLCLISIIKRDFEK